MSDQPPRPTDAPAPAPPGGPDFFQVGEDQPDPQTQFDLPVQLDGASSQQILTTDAAAAAGGFPAPAAFPAPAPINFGAAPAAAPEPAAEAEGQPGETPPAPSPAGFVPAPRATSRTQRTQQYARQAAQAQLHSFKKLLYPVCYCVAALMFLLGMLAVLELLGLHELWDSSARYITWIFMASWPVGLILIVGAVMFHRDVKRHELAVAEEEQAKAAQDPPQPR